MRLLILCILLCGCGYREIGKSLTLADQALERALVAKDPKPLIQAAKVAIGPAIQATGKQDPGPVPMDDQEFIKHVYIQAGRAYQEAALWVGLRTFLDPSTWEGLLAQLGLGGGALGILGLLIRNIAKNKAALKDAVDFGKDAVAGNLKPEDHKKRQKANGTYDLIRRLR